MLEIHEILEIRVPPGEMKEADFSAGEVLRIDYFETVAVGGVRGDSGFLACFKPMVIVDEEALDERVDEFREIVPPGKGKVYLFGGRRGAGHSVSVVRDCLRESGYRNIIEKESTDPSLTCILNQDGGRIESRRYTQRGLEL